MNLTGLDFPKIIVWVLIWLFGYSLGLLEAWVKEKAKKKTEVKPEVIQGPPQIIEEDYTLALFENTEQLILKLDKVALNSPTDLNDTQRKRLIALVVKLRPWLDGSKSKAPQPQPQSSTVQPVARPVMPPPVSSSQLASSKIESQPLFIEHTAEDTGYAMLGMVEQINWILQKKLEHHPLKTKRIRLKGALTGGVEFHVGSHHYEFIDEIEDPDVREIIQQAIREWEEKSTPGL